MVRKTIFAIWLAASLAGCGNSAPDIRGTYVSPVVDGPESKATRLMEVSPLSADSKDLYTIVIISTYQRKLGADSLGPVTKGEPLRLQGKYDSRNHALEIEEWGRSLPVDEQKGTITNLTNVFTKVK